MFLTCSSWSLRLHLLFCVFDSATDKEEISEEGKDVPELSWVELLLYEWMIECMYVCVSCQTTEKSKVVCVKFPAQSVDEAYLRKLTEPFGKIVKILMFPSLVSAHASTHTSLCFVITCSRLHPHWTLDLINLEFKMKKILHMDGSRKTVVVCIKLD